MVFYKLQTGGQAKYLLRVCLSGERERAGWKADSTRQNLMSAPPFSDAHLGGKAGMDEGRGHFGEIAA